jgi:N-methylhydantoinase B
LIAPLFASETLVGFVANRAHHADIGADTPGSMPLSGSLEEEGIVIPPTFLFEQGVLNDIVLASVTDTIGNPVSSRGDFFAQISANHTGVRRLGDLVQAMGIDLYLQGLQQLNDYAERLSRHALSVIPKGVYRFDDVLDDDGLGHEDIPIAVGITVDENQIHVDFDGTASQVGGNVNCPLSVAAAAVYYVFRCLMPPQTPACAGSFRPIEITAPEGCLLNARRPAAVAAGNVETSMRVVDVVMGALAQALPRQMSGASQGTMNNVAMGARGDGPRWDYYETIGGGMGAGMEGGGLSAVQSHMTNTLNTPIESLEMHYPLRITRYAVRRKSGGAGWIAGGDGLIREFEFLSAARVTLLTERRRHRPWGIGRGGPAAAGANTLNNKELPGKCTLEVRCGDRLTIETPGGGGWAP